MVGLSKAAAIALLTLESFNGGISSWKIKY